MQSPLKAILVDDEPFARYDLLYMLSSHPEIEVIGEAGTLNEAERLLSERTPDVVFLDIQMRGGSGFDLIPHIPPSTDIIFFTAYDEYAVRAFEANALDYLLKPVAAERLAASLTRLVRRRGAKTFPAQLPSPFSSDDQIYFKTDSEQRFVPIGTVEAVTAAGGNYTALHLADGKKPLIRRTLKEWADLLPKDLFFRIHRSTIVNLRCVDRLGKEENGVLRVCLAGHREAYEVSRRTASRLKALVDKMD